MQVTVSVLLETLGDVGEYLKFYTLLQTKMWIFSLFQIDSKT